MREGGEGTVRTREPRQAEGPLPGPFTETSLPPNMLGEPPIRDRKWIASLSPLPEGFEPVRIERDGARVVAISLSQNYDPTGEVSGGGYWVHLSDDGGKTWRRPLYTGLADRFPYVVLPDSKLPLIDGGTLDIAVEIEELDLNSITYPPVALRTKRQAKGLYLKAPISELSRDSDGDGLTDIAARHLLLGLRSPGSATPMRVGQSSAKTCPTAISPDQQAMVALLDRIFSTHTGAIIEPVNRDLTNSQSAILSEVMAAARRDPNSRDRPIFILGDPKDFACLHTDRLMIVYSQNDIDRLSRMTPDFHAVSLTPIVFNRAHDRGYVSWSTGWSGGTARLTKSGSSWIFEELEGWIS